jgi:hypothetical protein
VSLGSENVGIGNGSGVSVGVALVVGDVLPAALWLLVLLVALVLLVVFVLLPPDVQPKAKRQNVNKVMLRMMDDLLLFKASPDSAAGKHSVMGLWI